jgi:GNAT superfamily N-acetyltransferase
MYGGVRRSTVVAPAAPQGTAPAEPAGAISLPRRSCRSIVRQGLRARSSSQRGLTVNASVHYLFSDHTLAQRLERTEARANAAFVESRARLEPESGACWIEVAGAYAMFDGVGSPLTQSFGLGLFDDVGDEELQALEAFFRARGAEVHHEVSPMADPALLALLGERGYRPIELSSVMYQPIVVDRQHDRSREERISVRLLDSAEADLWAGVAAEGWSSESAGLADFMRSLGEVSARAEGTYAFLAERDGEPIAAGSLSIGERVALLAGASTIPRGRKQGAQRALLEARLGFAAEQGCELAMMAAAPGSASQRNAERQGFRIAYTRIKWALHRPAA